MVEKTRITKIYTKFGDGGNTVLVGGEITAKDSERVEAYGDIDELNSIIGLALVGLTSKKVRNILSKIQNDLFILGADLASKKNVPVPRIKKNRINWAETTIDKYVLEVGTLKEFILPAGSFAASTLHIARTVCRRAERKIVSLGKKEWISPNSLIYVNRLSDLLFVLARYENKISGQGEIFANFKK